MSEIGLHMDETALILFLPSRVLPVLMSVCEETRRQAEISLRAASHFFKEMWILDWEKRPDWKRHLGAFIKLPISFLTFATIRRPWNKAFGLQWLWNNRITVTRANYMTWQSCTFFWLALLNRWGTSELLVPTKTCLGKHGKFKQRTISPVATNSCIKAERPPHREGQNEGKYDRKSFFGTRQFTEEGLRVRQSDIKWMLLHPSDNTELWPTLIKPQHHGGFASVSRSRRQLNHRDVTCWPSQEQPFSCSAKARKNCCWHGL